MEKIGIDKCLLFLFQELEKSIDEVSRIDEEDDFKDIIAGCDDLFAYTRGNSKEIKIRNLLDEKFEKTITSPHTLLNFRLSPSGKYLVAITSEGYNASGTSIDIYIVVWNASSWDIVKDVQSNFDHMLSGTVFMSMQVVQDGIQLIWCTYYEINFWNVDTEKESIALKQVRTFLPF